MRLRLTHARRLGLECWEIYDEHGARLFQCLSEQQARTRFARLVSDYQRSRGEFDI